MTMKVSGRDNATLTIPITDDLQSERGTTGGDSRSRQTCPTTPFAAAQQGNARVNVPYVLALACYLTPDSDEAISNP
jgi:hypothetical protein